MIFAFSFIYDDLRWSSAISFYRFINKTHIHTKPSKCFRWFLAEPLSPPSFCLSLTFNILFSGIWSSDTCFIYTYENVKALKILAPALGFFTFSVCALPSMMIIIPSHSRGSARYNRLSCTHVDNIYPSRLSNIRRCSTQRKRAKSIQEERGEPDVDIVHLCAALFAPSLFLPLNGGGSKFDKGIAWYLIIIHVQQIK